MHTLQDGFLEHNGNDLHMLVLFKIVMQEVLLPSQHNLN